MISPSIVIGILAKRFGIEYSTDITREEMKLAARIGNLLDDGQHSGFDCEEEDQLDIEHERDESWDYDDMENHADTNTLGDDCDTVEFNGKTVTCAEVRTAISHRRSAKKGTRSLDSMSNRYRWIQKQKDIDRLVKYEKAGEARASRLVRLRRLAELVKERVISNFEKGLTMHDVDLQFLAVRINKEHKLLDNFNASHSWIQRLKNKNGWCSRRVTTFVTKKTMINEEVSKKAAADHVDIIKALMQTYSLDAIANCDQSGFNKELHGSRTLANVGEKTVTRLIQSSSATTHSYTILPVLYASGKLGKKLFILMQEHSGKFPARGHFQADNIVVRAAKSHMMRKEHMDDFLRSCFWDSSDPQEMILMLDSWPSFRDKQAIQSTAPSGRQSQVINIPPGTTSTVQPLDVYFFRPFKAFVKRVNQYVICHDMDFKISARDNILKVISQIYWLFCNPIFKEFLQYSWHAAGYLEHHPGPFPTPVDHCMPIDSYSECSLAKCSGQGLIFCAYCEKYYCFRCFL